MKANILDAKKAKWKLKQAVKDEALKHCGKCLEQLKEEFEVSSKYNALFHTLHMLVILHDEFGFGKKRLQRLLGAYAEADESFKHDLDDGVVWTKLRRRLEDIGLEFSKEDIEICNAKERLYEKGITYYTDKKKGRK